ncbi:MAG: hypothetical protein NVS9B15_22920 [Acidobacteriaceae bacterium]
MRNLRLSLLAGLTLSLLLLVGCPQGTSIARLNAESGRYMGREVAIRGHVVSSFGVFGTGAYEVDDGTGTIWVLSNGYGVPGNGSRVAVVGRYTSGVSVGGRALAAAIRQTQRPHYSGSRY